MVPEPDAYTTGNPLCLGEWLAGLDSGPLAYPVFVSTWYAMRVEKIREPILLISPHGYVARCPYCGWEYSHRVLMSDSKENCVQHFRICPKLKPMYAQEETLSLD